MDSKGRRVIAAPQASGRMSDQGPSERVNLSPPPCPRRLRRLQETRVIREPPAPKRRRPRPASAIAAAASCDPARAAGGAPVGASPGRLDAVLAVRDGSRPRGSLT